MNAYEILEYARIALSLAFLLTSSYHDYKSRSIPNIIFKIFIPIATILTITGVFLTPSFQTQLITFAATYLITLHKVFSGSTGLTATEQFIIVKQS